MGLGVDAQPENDRLGSAGVVAASVIGATIGSIAGLIIGSAANRWVEIYPTP